MDIGSSISNDSLADILERVLQNGVVVAGDVSISLVGIELVTIKLRLLIASVDKAKELGINWWEHDPMLTARPAPPELAADETETLQARISHLEQQLAALSA